VSLFLVSGAVLSFFHGRKYTGSSLGSWFITSFLVITSVLTSARTGIVAFVFTMFVVSMLLLTNGSDRKSLNKVVLLFLANTIIIIIGFIVFYGSRGTAIFSDSGRHSLNINALNIFRKAPLYGIGFGDINYAGTLPHNIVFQSLAQGGLIYTIPIITFIIVLLISAFNRDKSIFATLVCIIFGAIFIPDIFDSRFFSVILAVSKKRSSMNCECVEYRRQCWFRTRKSSQVFSRRHL
jgi:hypothetical protein